MSFNCYPNSDEIELQVDSAVIRVNRRLSYEMPHEVTAIIPRAEIRRRRYDNGQLAWEEEIILNSLTVVHSPLRPAIDQTSPANGCSPAATEQPVSCRRFSNPRPRLKLTYS
ncbi:MAG: hypothetical protein GX039_04590 [Clostridia bacterium]|nr:hypothetical protein [Clostridia bacterium]